MLTLTLVRHGETEWNVTRRLMGQSDVPLNETGRAQAAALAQRLAGRTFDAAYSSDLSRAAQTAQAITQAAGIAFKPEPRLREIAFGVIEGLTYEEAQVKHTAIFNLWQSDRDQPPGGGEAISVFSARCDGLLDVLKARHPDQSVLLVTHGGPIREMLRLALRLPPEGHWSFQVDNASLTELALYGDSAVLVRLNDTCHLG